MMAGAVITSPSNRALFLLGIVICDELQIPRLIQRSMFKDVSRYVFLPKWDFMILQVWN